MNIYYGYTRISTAKQGEGVSLAAQKEAIIHYALKHDLAVTQWFEEAETAASVGRPVFNQMTKLLHQGHAQGVIIHKIDRSTRNFRDWAQIGDLSDKGVEIHFVTESLDFQSRGGRLSADIQVVIAADYIRNLKEESLKGLYGRLKQGLYPFKAPLGYLDNGGGKVKTIDPSIGPMITEAFRLYASEEYSIRSLSDELATMGLARSCGRTVNTNSLNRILRNPFYYGDILIQRNGQIFPGIHQALISNTLFDRVQVILDKRCSRKIVRHDHRYRRSFACGLCSRAMIAERKKAFVYYRCHTKTCSTKTIREEVIDQEVQSFFLSYSLAPDQEQELSKRLNNWFSSRAVRPNPTTAIRCRLGHAQTRMSKTTDALIDGLISAEEHQVRTAQLKTQIDVLEVQLAKCRQHPNARELFQIFLEKISTFDQLQLNNREVRELLNIISTNRRVLNWMVFIEPTEASLELLELLLRRIFHRIELKSMTSP